jgi:hypothetical protein
MHQPQCTFTQIIEQQENERDAINEFLSHAVITASRGAFGRELVEASRTEGDTKMLACDVLFGLVSLS